MDTTRAHLDPYLDADCDPFVTDRERILHSAAFRRLQGKTQALPTTNSDHVRTRLAHTLEVASLARSIAARFELNEPLVEAAALAHDLGHPPFGHAGERALDEVFARSGGFNHNAHSLRVVTQLERPYPSFPGLNLTFATRACLAGHATQFDQPETSAFEHINADGADRERTAVDLADRLAFSLHDLQDAVYAELITPNELRALDLWRAALSNQIGCPDADGAPTEWRRVLRWITDALRAFLVRELRCDADSIVLTEAAESMLRALEQLLLDRVYRSDWVRAADSEGANLVRALAEFLRERPDALPERFTRRLSDETLDRVIIDYIAGMTDSFARSFHARYLSR